MNTKIMVFAEINNGELSPAYYELLTKAIDLFRGRDATFAAAYVYKYDEKIKKKILNSGIDEAYFFENEKLKEYYPDHYATALENIVDSFNPDVLLIPATAIGEELAPSIGVRFNTGVAAHCIDMEMKEDGSLAYIVPAFGGKVIGEIFIPNGKPQVASINPGVFMSEMQKSKDSIFFDLDNEIIDDIKTSVEILNIDNLENNIIPVENADVVLCGGYGVGSKDSWNSIEELAQKLSFGTGYTRPLVDAEWVDNEINMIGISGKTIKPKVYIGFGVSGAAHHVCGMKNSGIVININNDPNADVFRVSDYKIVADSNTILRSLKKTIESP